MEYDELPLWRQEEYDRRVEKIKKAHPGKFYPSEFHHKARAASREALMEMVHFYEEHRDDAWPFRLPTGPIQKMASFSLLHSAALGDKVDCMRLWRYYGADVNVKDSRGNNALMWAVGRNRLGVAEWLLARGAKISFNKKTGHPVLWACYKGCVPALNMFRYYGVDFNKPCARWVWKMGIPRKEFYYPIEIASLSDQPQAAKAVQWLVDHDVSIDNKKPGFLSIREELQALPDNFQPGIREILAQKAKETPLPLLRQRSK